MKHKFIRPSESIYSGEENNLNTTTAIYANQNRLINEIFYRRLERLTRMLPDDPHGKIALDLGCARASCYRRCAASFRTYTRWI